MKLMDLLAIKGLGVIESEITSLEERAKKLKEMVSTAKERRIGLISGLTDEVARIAELEKRING